MAQPDAHVRALLHAFFLEHPSAQRETFDAFRARHEEFGAELNELYSEVAKLREVLHLTPASIVGGMEGSLSPELAGVDIDRRPPRIQGFEMLEELGHGGMGVVWKARDTELGRAVAVKVLHEKLATNEAALKRFVVEARITGQLQHPGVVSVYRLGVAADGRPFLAMKLIRGRTLAKIWSNRDGSSVQLLKQLAIFQRVCEAVAYAHSRGVIHRDLKPANVMVGSFGQVQVLDWGLAKVLGEEDSNPDASVITPTSPDSPASNDSVAGSVVGTPSYMAPEQAAGEAESVSQRSDVFALGGMLCELLTGRSMQVKRRRDALRYLAECGADRDLVEFTRKCLAENPDERPADAGHVARAVSKYLSSVDQRARKARQEAAAAIMRVQQERKARRLLQVSGSAVLAAILIASFALRQSWQNQVLAAEGTAATLANAQWLFERGDYESSARAATSILQEAHHSADSKAHQLELLARNAELMSRLTRHRPFSIAFVNNAWTQQEIRAEFEQAFQAHGVDVLAGDTTDVARHLERAGIQGLVRPLLDDWTRTEFYLDGWSSADTRHLMALASALDVDPTRREMREILAETQDREELRALLTRADGLDPASFLLLFESMALLYSAEDWGELSDVHGAAFEVLERYPDDVNVLVSLAGVSFMRGERQQERDGGVITPAALTFFHETIEHLGAICSIESDNGRGAIAWAFLGDLYARLGDARRSDAAFSQAVQLVRRDAPSENYNLYAVMVELGATDRVVEHLEEALAEYPETASLWRELAYNLCLPSPSIDVQRALAAARQAAEIDPGLEGVQAGLATALYYAGAFRECAEVLGHILDADPAHPDGDHLGLMRAICLHELGQEEEAGQLGRRMLRRLEKSWGSSAGMVHERGRELFSPGS